MMGIELSSFQGVQVKGFIITQLWPGDSLLSVFLSPPLYDLTTACRICLSPSQSGDSQQQRASLSPLSLSLLSLSYTEVIRTHMTV